jgi:hypothetical protein
MYSNKLAAAIKVNGKVLREHKDTVYIPFGSEYSILVKNLETRRVIVNIFIDGENVVPNGLVINAGQEIDLERSLANNNMSQGNRFKFIERTEGVEQTRGVKLEDGLIRIEYNFEQVQQTYIPPVTFTQPAPWKNSGYNNRDYDTFTLTASGSASGALRSKGSGMSVSSTSVMYDAITPQSVSYSSNDAGITVPGSISNQTFGFTSNFLTENTTHSMIIKLLGETPDNKPILKPVTVKHKPKCVTCHKVNKANAKFCNECGTGLLIA